MMTIMRMRSAILTIAYCISIQLFGLFEKFLLSGKLSSIVATTMVAEVK